MGLDWAHSYKLPGGSDSKESACNVADLGSIPRLGKFPGEGNGNPLQYSCLGNTMDRGAWWATVHGITRVRHSWVINTFAQITQVNLSILLPETSITCAKSFLPCNILLSLFFFFLYLAMPLGSWFLSSSTRDWTQALSGKSVNFPVIHFCLIHPTTVSGPVISSNRPGFAQTTPASQSSRFTPILHSTPTIWPPASPTYHDCQW